MKLSVVGVPASVRAFFDREVKPHVPDAWIDTRERDPKDGKIGIIGYEINFNRPRSLSEKRSGCGSRQASGLRLRPSHDVLDVQGFNYACGHLTRPPCRPAPSRPSLSSVSPTGS